jgi:hypothetical protein
MGIADSNIIIRTYLLTQAPLTALIGGVTPRIYAANPLPAGYTLPAVSFSGRGGTATPYYHSLVYPSIQFKCWANDSIIARSVYLKLFDALNGKYEVPVIVGATTHLIVRSEEEVHGQDGVDPDIPGLYFVLSFFKIKILTQ